MIYAIVTFEQIDQYSILYLPTFFLRFLCFCALCDTANSIYCCLYLDMRMLFDIFSVKKLKNQDFDSVAECGRRYLHMHKRYAYTTYTLHDTRFAVAVQSVMFVQNRGRIVWESLNSLCSRAKRTQLMSFQFPYPDSGCVYHVDCFWLKEMLTNENGTSYRRRLMNVCDKRV